MPGLVDGEDKVFRRAATMAWQRRPGLSGRGRQVCTSYEKLPGTNQFVLCKYVGETTRSSEYRFIPMPAKSLAPPTPQHVKVPAHFPRQSLHDVACCDGFFFGLPLSTRSPPSTLWVQNASGAGPAVDFDLLLVKLDGGVFGPEQ